MCRSTYNIKPLFIRVALTHRRRFFWFQICLFQVPPPKRPLSLDLVGAQAENQLLPLLMTLNTPHFDFASCNFSLKHMSRVDSGDGGLSAEGTGRVFYGRHAGVLRSYTLECNYNTGKVCVFSDTATQEPVPDEIKNPPLHG